jgi:hypothetical protein
VTLLSIVLLLLTAVVALPGWTRTRLPADVLPLVLVVLLSAAALAAAVAESGVTGWQAGVARVVTVAAAVVGGGPVTAAVLRRASTGSQPAIERAEHASAVLRGGTWIGALERAAMSATLLAGWPAGVPVVLAVKGLGRYPELREPGVSERFIIGTLASLLWAAGAAGTGMLLLP